jgi:hypothetical protein
MGTFPRDNCSEGRVRNLVNCIYVPYVFGPNAKQIASQSISSSVEGISAKRLHDGKPASRLFEIASVLGRVDHIASIIVNANRCIMRAAVKLCVSDCVRTIKLSLGLVSGFVFVRRARKQIIFSDFADDVVTIELADRAQFR